MTLGLPWLERELLAIGRFGPGYTCHSWRENLAMGRARSRIRGQRYKVWGYKVHNADGTYTWQYQYGPYAAGVPRALAQRGCTGCGLVGRSRIHCLYPYHDTKKAVQDYIEIFGEVGTIGIPGIETTVRISAEA